MKHNDKGALSMWYHEGYLSYSFYINTIARLRRDGIHVVIGKVTEHTYDVVEKIMSVGYGRPPRARKEIVIVNCGVI